MINISQLRKGDTARVLGFQTIDKRYRQKLMSLGLTLGTRFEVLRRAPLGDPIALSVRGCCICLRKQEAQALLLERCV